MTYSHAFDIVGTEDKLSKLKSQLDQRAEIDTGHLSLLDHPQSLQTMTRLLQASAAA